MSTPPNSRRLRNAVLIFGSLLALLALITLSERPVKQPPAAESAVARQALTPPPTAQTTAKAVATLPSTDSSAHIAASLSAAAPEALEAPGAVEDAPAPAQLAEPDLHFSAPMQELVAHLDAGQPLALRLGEEAPRQVLLRQHRLTTEGFRISTGEDAALPASMRHYQGLALRPDKGQAAPERISMAVVNGAYSLAVDAADGQYLIEHDGITTRAYRGAQNVSGLAGGHGHGEADACQHCSHCQIDTDSGLATMRAGPEATAWTPVSVSLAAVDLPASVATEVGIASWVDHNFFRLGRRYEASLRDLVVMYASSKSQTGSGSASNLASRAASYFTYAGRVADTYERQLGMRYLLQELILVPEGFSIPDPGNPAQASNDLGHWRQWLSAHRPQSTYRWGHAALFTLVGGSAGGVIGQATLNGYGSLSGVSVQERNYGWDVINHEMGHNVGANHTNGGVMNSSLRVNNEDFFRRVESKDFTAAMDIYNTMHGFGEERHFFGEAPLRHPEEMPFGVDDLVTTPINTPVVLAPLINDLQAVPDGASNQLRLIETGSVYPPNAGTISILGDELQFTPATGFVGKAWFTYTLAGNVGNRGQGWLHSADVIITVGGGGNPTLTPPLQLADDHLRTAFKKPLRINPLLNDYGTGRLWNGNVDAIVGPEGTTESYSDGAFFLVGAQIISGTGSLTLETRRVVDGGNPTTGKLGSIIYHPGPGEGDLAVIRYTAQDAFGSQGTADIFLHRSAEVWLEASDIFLAEASGKVLDVQVRRSADADLGSPEEVLLRFDGNVDLTGLRADLAFSRHTAFDAGQRQLQVVIPAGQTSQHLTLTALADGLIEEGEFLDLHLFDTSSLVIDASAASVRIYVDDLPTRSLQDFENSNSSNDLGGGWSQATDDGFDWTLNSGGTPITSTGPSGDFPSGAGQYVYAHAAGNNHKTARLLSPTFNLSGKHVVQLAFAYNMYGSNDFLMGKLALEAARNGGAFEEIWSRSGVQSSSPADWRLATVDWSADLPADSVQFRFASTPPDSASDIAIDFVRLLVDDLPPASAPTVLVPPQNQIVELGDSAYLSIAAAAQPAPTYQWRRNGTPIGGATGPSYHLASVGNADLGQYTVVVTNSLNSIISAPGILSLAGNDEPPSIITQPSNQTVIEGGATSFSITAAGSAPLQYQWRFNNTPLSDGDGVSGSASPTLSLSAVSLSRAGNYRCRVSNSHGEITSANASLTVHAKPTAAFSLNTTSGPAPLELSLDASASQAGVGSTISSYAWDFGDGTNASGVNATHTYASPGIYSITLTVTNSFGVSDSDSKDVEVTRMLSAVASADPSAGGAPLTVHFHGSASGGSVSPTLVDATGLIIRYSIDSGSGATVVDNAGGDDAGSLTDGSQVAGAGVFGGAVQLGGSGRIAIPSSSAFNTGGPWSSRCVALWFQASSVTGGESQVLFEAGGGVRGWAITLNDDQLVLSGWNNGTGGWDRTDLTLPASIIADRWYHVAMVLDAPDGLNPEGLRGYLDGQLLASGPAAALNAHSDGGAFGGLNGGSAAGGSGPLVGFAGRLDEMRVYNRVLSGSEIADLADDGYSYHWDFVAADGLQIDATGRRTQHTYSSTGTFICTLTVSDGIGTASTTVPITVSGNTSPTITSLTANPNPVLATSTSLAVEASDPDGDDLTATWQILSQPTGANAALGSGEAPSVIFDRTGTYVFRATVSDGKGGSAQQNLNVEVLASPSELLLTP